MTRLPAATAALLFALAAHASAETGYDLWLRYQRLRDPARLRSYRSGVTAIVGRTATPAADVAVSELRRGLRGLLGNDVPAVRGITAGALVVGTPATSLEIAALGWQGALAPLGDFG